MHRGDTWLVCSHHCTSLHASDMPLTSLAEELQISEKTVPCTLFIMYACHKEQKSRRRVHRTIIQKSEAGIAACNQQEYALLMRGLAIVHKARRTTSHL